MKTTTKCRDRLVFSPQLANYLIQCGYVVINLKPNREIENATVFVFKGDPGLDEIILE